MGGYIGLKGLAKIENEAKCNKRYKNTRTKS